MTDFCVYLANAVTNKKTKKRFKQIIFFPVIYQRTHKMLTFKIESSSPTAISNRVEDTIVIEHTSFSKTIFKGNLALILIFWSTSVSLMVNGLLSKQPIRIQIDCENWI